MKHLKDIIRLITLIPEEVVFIVNETVKRDLNNFINQYELNPYNPFLLNINISPFEFIRFINNLFKL